MSDHASGVLKTGDVENALKTLAFDTKSETVAGTLVGPGVDFQIHSKLAMDCEMLVLKGDDVSKVFIAIDEICLDTMISKHTELFPNSKDMNSADVDSLFNPFVKRPRQQEVRVPIAKDALIRDAAGTDINLTELETLAQGGNTDIDCIAEFSGFCVEPSIFAPVITVTEIAITPTPVEPPKKRVARLVNNSIPISVSVAAKKN